MHESGIVLAGGVIDLYNQKLNEIKSLIGPTLAVIGLIFVIVAYVSFRSWKKAAIAGIGAAIVMAVVAKITGLSNMVKSEFQADPRHGDHVVVRVDDTKPGKLV